MAVAVTATGNHFFFDSVAGVAVAALALGLLRVRRRRSYPRLRAVPDPVDAPRAEERRAA